MPDRDDTVHWKTFGRWLRASRKERTYRTGQPRHELAKLAGVSDNTWGTWERGGRNMGGNWVVYRPKPESLVGIARALAIPVDTVFAKAKVTLDPYQWDEPVPMEVDPSPVMATLSLIMEKLEELSSVRGGSDPRIEELQAKVDELLAEREQQKRSRRPRVDG